MGEELEESSPEGSGHQRCLGTCIANPSASPPGAPQGLVALRWLLVKMMWERAEIG